MSAKVVSVLSALLLALLAGLFSPAQARDNYASIAYSFSDGKWGYSYDYPTVRQAENAAIGYCRDAGGRACESVGWVGNGCGALAVGRNDWSAATGLSRGAAERAARNKCSRLTSRCEIKVWVCTTR